MSAGLSAEQLAPMVAELERMFYSGVKRSTYEYQGVRHELWYQDGIELKRALDDARTRHAELTGAAAGGLAVSTVRLT